MRRKIRNAAGALAIAFALGASSGAAVFALETAPASSPVRYVTRPAGQSAPCALVTTSDDIGWRDSAGRSHDYMAPCAGKDGR